MPKRQYVFEPSLGEIALAELLGRTVMQRYYSAFVRGLGLLGNERVLDYCTGSGIIAAKISARLGAGQLVAADVSELWLRRAKARLHWFRQAQCAQLKMLNGKVLGGGYDFIVLHFVLHDFPYKLRKAVIQHLLENLNPTGIIRLREPLGGRHGLQLFELANLLESTHQLEYAYEKQQWALGEFVDVRCKLK